MSDFGNSMYTITSNVPQNELWEIKKEDIADIKLLPKEIENMNFCNLDLNGLIGYYYDKNGNIYLETGIQFKLKIKDFGKIYKKNKKSKINVT